MPEISSASTAATVEALSPAPSGPQPKGAGATKRKLGLGGWIAASWLILMVVISIVAEPIHVYWEGIKLRLQDLWYSITDQI